MDTFDRYRVYPNDGRARTFKFLNKAIQFAEGAYSRQSLTDYRAVTVVIGSGTTYVDVGRVDVNGWRYAAGYD